MNIALIFAGGVGSRMNSVEKPKQFLELHNKPIIIHTIEHFENHPLIDAIVLVCVEEWIDYCKEILERYNIKKVKRIVAGGKTGQMSIYLGLKAANEFATEDSIVLIHDGVRPLINEQIITDNIDSVKKFGSAITTSKVTETILVVEEESKKISEVPDRNNSRVAKAPQSYYLKDVLSVEEEAVSKGEENWIDTCTLMNHYGYKLHLIDGPAENIKITTPTDFYIMRAIIDARENAQIYGY